MPAMSRPIELGRPPKNPLKPSFVPPGCRPHKVQDGEDWHTVANVNYLDVNALVFVNFYTNNTDEVNWYLRHRVGCHVSRDGRNYAFSSDAKPGIIYIPWPNLPTVRIVDPPKNSLAKFLREHSNDPDESLEKLHFALDVVEVAHIGLGITEVGALSLGVASFEVLAPLAAEASVFIGIAAGYSNTIESLKRNQYYDGLSEGIVLGANQALPTYVGNNFWLKRPVDTPYFPEQGKNLQNVHNVGIAEGYKFGKQLTTEESQTLFHEINLRMPPIAPNPETSMGPDYWSQMNERARKVYYQNAAIVFRSIHLRT
jgi:hypothetical protein